MKSTGEKVSLVLSGASLLLSLNGARQIHQSGGKMFTRADNWRWVKEHPIAYVVISLLQAGSIAALHPTVQDKVRGWLVAWAITRYFDTHREEPSAMARYLGPEL